VHILFVCTFEPFRSKAQAFGSLVGNTLHRAGFGSNFKRMSPNRPIPSQWQSKSVQPWMRVVQPGKSWKAQRDPWQRQMGGCNCVQQPREVVPIPNPPLHQEQAKAFPRWFFLL
jgi:hypothetical protein